MLAYDISKLKRNPKAISSYLKTSGDVVTTKEDLQVMIPTRYIDTKLATIDNTVKTIGIYAIVDSKNNYAISTIPTVQELSPVSVEDALVGEEKYKILNFNKNSVFMPNSKLIVTADYMYQLFDNFYSQGRVPWFLDYEDLCDLLLESKQYMGNGIGEAILAFEIITSISAREASKPTNYYRLSNMKNKPTYVGLKNLFYSYNNTGAKLVGNYFKTGLMTAMMDPETKSSETSNILRK